MRTTIKHILSIALLAASVILTALLATSCQSQKSYIEDIEYKKIDSSDAYEVTGIGVWGGGDLVIPAEVNGLPVRGIAADAFANCTSLKSLTISGGVSYIADRAFLGCTSLECVTLPATLSNIGVSAFEKCEKLFELDLGGVMHIGDSAFRECNSLIEVNLPDDLVNLGAYAFCDSKKLEWVNISLGLTEISDFTFAGCDALVSADLHDDIVSIGESAFLNCRELSDIQFGVCLAEIGKHAFSGCDNLTYAHFKVVDCWIADNHDDPIEVSNIVADLIDPTIAADHLTSTYVEHFWHREE